MPEVIITEGSTWIDRSPSVAGTHAHLFRRLLRVDSVGDRYISGLSYWESRSGTASPWERDGGRGRPTRILRQAFERKFEPFDRRSPEEMLREQIARDILDYAQEHNLNEIARDALDAAAHIARGENPRCSCSDNSWRTAEDLAENLAGVDG